MNADFGVRLRQFRDNLKLSQRKLAQKTGIFQTTLNSYENAAEDKDLRLPLHFLQGLASLGCDLHWLLTGVASPSVEPAEGRRECRVAR